MTADVFDYIIVGGGTAGCVLANRLSADAQHRVLLLEAGPPYREHLLGIPLASYLQVHKHVWHYRTAPQKGCNGREVSLPCGRVIGGGSSVNGMLYVRGEPHCYDAWAQRGNPGWSYAEVLPYFRRAESCEQGAGPFHGGDGPVHTSKVRFRTEYDERLLAGFRELGLPENADFCGDSQLGVGWLDVSQRKGWRSSAQEYLKQASGRSNLTVLTNAQVRRLEIVDGRATGVRYRIGGEERVAQCSGEVLLAAGAIGSPKILLLSGIGPANHLRSLGIPVVHHLPGVGENLQDHLRVPVYYRRRIDFAPVPTQLLSKTRHMVEFLASGTGLMTSPVIAAVIAFAKLLPHNPGVDCQFTPTIWGSDPESRYMDCVNLQPCLVGTRSAGRVRLADADPDAEPVIDPAYLTHKEDVAVMLQALRLSRRLAASEAFAGLLGEEVKPGPQVQSDEDLIRYIRDHVETCFHPVGTCRMGPDDMAVVDANLRLRGIAGLRVIDASIMPSIINGNTNAPTLMIAEKGAALVLTGA